MKALTLPGVNGLCLLPRIDEKLLARVLGVVDGDGMQVLNLTRNIQIIMTYESKAPLNPVVFELLTKAVQLTDTDAFDLARGPAVILTYEDVWPLKRFKAMTPHFEQESYTVSLRKNDG